LGGVESPNSAWIMAHLKNKAEMKHLWQEMESYFANTPTLRYTVSPWNPAELAIADPPQLKIAIRGGWLQNRTQVAHDLQQLLEENQVFPRLWTDPTVTRTQNVVLQPYHNLWSSLKSQGAPFSPSDLADLVRVMTAGRKIGELTLEGVKRDITLGYSTHLHLNAEDISSIPIGLGDKIIPLKALSQVKTVDAIPLIYQENQREMVVISGKQNEGDSSRLAQVRLKKAKDLVENWIKSQKPEPGSFGASQPIISFEEASPELRDAMSQLCFAVLLSIALIFLILMIQFGNLANALLVLVAIPLGMIGVLVSLFVFRSTLSLNSILGVILLNGVAVANSIILVDFLKQRVNQGLAPRQAALEAARKRIRPIFITSLATILGMLPVALGLGEGGRVLQPLGIAVAGGLWVSMGLTLFIVPSLQVSYLNWKNSQ